MVCVNLKSLILLIWIISVGKNSPPPPHYTAYVFFCNAECLFKLASVLYNFIILVCIDSLLVFYAANSFFLYQIFISAVDLAYFRICLRRLDGQQLQINHQIYLKNLEIIFLTRKYYLVKKSPLHLLYHYTYLLRVQY